MGLFKKILIPLSHYPTAFLLIGYPVFWCELYFGHTQNGTTSLAAWGAVAVWGIFLLGNDRGRSLGRLLVLFCSWMKKASLRARLFYGIAAIFALSALAIIFYASIFPLHLGQEFDVINYHVTLPRQHLLAGSFRLISWATADLYFFPVDLALAPYWLATFLPNKFPQFIFFLGLLAVSARLAYRFSNGEARVSVWVMLSVLGMHIVGIQAGTGMLDLMLCYLFLAAMDSFLAGAYVLSAAEFMFYFWSKSFIPAQVFIIGTALCLIVWILHGRGFQVCWDFGRVPVMAGIRWRQWVIGCALLSVLIGGPFLAKSMFYSGTPLFPFGVGLMKPLAETSAGRFEEIRRKADECVANKDRYGDGRSWRAFAEHLWLIAVPENNVNNRYDYPVGLVYLLLAVPFLFYFARALRRGKVPVLGLWAILYWGLWWFGSQQTRFLFIPLILMPILLLPQMPGLSRVLRSAIVVALFMTLFSLYGAHKADWGRSAYDVLRAKDKALLAIAVPAGQKEPVVIDFPDAAFAGFPVDVQGIESVFVLER